MIAKSLHTGARFSQLPLRATESIGCGPKWSSRSAMSQWSTDGLLRHVVYQGLNATGDPNRLPRGGGECPKARTPGQDVQLGTTDGYHPKLGLREDGTIHQSVADRRLHGATSVDRPPLRSRSTGVSIRKKGTPPWEVFPALPIFRF